MPPASKYNTVPCYVWPMPVSNLIPSAAAIAPAMAETGARIGNCRLRAVGGRVLFAEIRVHRQYFQPWIQLAQSFCNAFHTWLADPIVRHQDLSIEIVRPKTCRHGRESIGRSPPPPDCSRPALPNRHSD